MNYNLKFVKISNEHQFAGVRFAGNIFITLNALSYTTIEDKMHVDMETNECVCTEKGNTIHETNNCWEYYFNQIKLDNSETVIDMDSLTKAKIHYEDRNMFMSPNNFIELKEKFYNSFQLKEYLKNLIQEYYDINIKGKVTLGVQVRLTDMKHYHKVPPIEYYLNKIKLILNERPEIEQIFLATDDSTVIKYLKETIVLWFVDEAREIPSKQQGPARS